MRLDERTELQLSEDTKVYMQIHDSLSDKSFSGGIFLAGLTNRAESLTDAGGRYEGKTCGEYEAEAKSKAIKERFEEYLKLKYEAVEG